MGRTTDTLGIYISSETLNDETAINYQLYGAGENLEPAYVDNSPLKGWRITVSLYEFHVASFFLCNEQSACPCYV